MGFFKDLVDAAQKAPPGEQALALPHQLVPVFRKPPPSMLLTTATQIIDKADASRKAKQLEERLALFGTPCKVIKTKYGPVITNFELKPEPTVKIARIMSLVNDLALGLAVSHIRISTSDHGTIDIEVPNAKRNTVSLKDVLGTPAFLQAKMNLPLGFGVTSTGEPVVVDLTTLPHLLIAGETGAGKSVFINTLLLSLLYSHTPDTLRLILIDPKRVELAPYNGTPHLVEPVISTPEAAVNMLKRVVKHMKDRYQVLEDAGARNLEDYNSNPENPHFPYLVVVIDELADLMLTNKKLMEHNIARIAQMARAVGIHLIIATQRPSVNIITGVIKANFPARVAFRVSSGVDSRVILDMHGAERLLGRGDMLYLSPAKSTPDRLHGPFTRQLETQRIVHFFAEQGRMPSFRWCVGAAALAMTDDEPEDDVITYQVTQTMTIGKRGLDDPRLHQFNREEG